MVIRSAADRSDFSRAPSLVPKNWVGKGVQEASRRYCPPATRQNQAWMGAARIIPQPWKTGRQCSLVAQPFTLTAARLVQSLRARFLGPGDEERVGREAGRGSFRQGDFSGLLVGRDCGA